MTDPTRPVDSLANNGFELAVAALVGIATMAQQALGDLRAMGFGALIDQQDAAIAAALSAAVALGNLNGGAR